ncbi:MAG: beta-galactosidase [Lentisphaeria bacterium]|nr:beta-galactosidase [Lentisphaeria bacterium]
MTEIEIPLKEIGRIRPRSADEIAGSPFTLGCEVLDRDFADYDEYKEYIVPLGIKTIRLQGGWAKTEKVPGTYDFAWLDHIIDDARSRGLNILLETDYGNPAYPGGGGSDLAGGFPESEEALAAWDRWVEAMAHRYAGKVRDWAMWNEPDIGGGDKPKTIPQIVDFNIRTMKIIRRIIPDARIAGLSLAHTGDDFDRYLALLQEKNELDSFDWIIYHGYLANPDRAYETGCRLQNFLARRTAKVKLRQGENGCPSERQTRFALSGIDWTELSQAKWDLRRYLGDIANGVETSVFTICDFNHIGREINRKGLLRAEADHKVVRKKTAYHAIQHMTSIFDDSLQPVPPDHAAVFFERNCALFPFADTQGRGNLLAYWDRSDVPGNEVRPETAEILFKDLPFDEPALVEMISGKIYEIPADRISRSGEYVVFRSMPILDTPFLIAEKRLLHLA